MIFPQMEGPFGESIHSYLDMYMYVVKKKQQTNGIQKSSSYCILNIDKLDQESVQHL